MGTGAVRCALIGLGMMGSEHAAILAASPAADLVVGCDLDPGSAGRRPPGTPFTTSLQDALDTPGLEAVVIATPPEHHATAVAAAVDRGLATFCEKPIAAGLPGADASSSCGSSATVAPGRWTSPNARAAPVAALAVDRSIIEGRPVALADVG